MSEPNSALFEVVFEMAQENKLLLERLRGALEKGDDAEALNIARALVGLPHTDS